MGMPGRTYSLGSTYRFGFNGQEKAIELDADGNNMTAEFWQFDSRVVKRWNLDIVNNAGRSGYSVLGNNPILLVDPKGAKEFENYAAYKKELGDKAIAEKDWKGQDGHWLTKSREAFDWLRTTHEHDNNIKKLVAKAAVMFETASEFNIKKKDGSKEYENLDQRAAFYAWFDQASTKKGHETKWANAAAETVDKLKNLLGSFATSLGYSNDEIKEFVRSGNKIILDDIWGNLQSLYNGPILKGTAAFEWDGKNLLKEQMLINDKYWNLSNNSLNILTEIVKKKGLSALYPGPALKGSLLSVTDRWVYGMTLMGYKVTTANVPIPAICPQSPSNPKNNKSSPN